MRFKEVEQKYALSDADTLRKRLLELDAKSKAGSPARQVDTYYNAPHRDFLEPDVISEWLRIRRDDRGASINFKLWHPLTEIVKTHADEYETVVADPEAVRHILESLGFTEMVTVDKTREEYVFTSGGPPVVVALDSIEGFGSFVEFEYHGGASTPEEASTELDRFLSELGVELGERVNKGYPHMMLGREH